MTTYAPHNVGHILSVAPYGRAAVTVNGGRSWAPIKGDSAPYDVLFGSDEQTVFGLEPTAVLRSNDGGQTFRAFFTPGLREGPVGLVTGRPLSSPLTFVMEGQEDRTSRQNRLAPVFRRDYLARLDLDARALTSVPLPLDARDCNREREGCSSGDAVEFAAYADGEPTAVALAVGRVGRTVFGDW